MLYKHKVDVGERLIRIPARGCVTDKGRDVKEMGLVCRGREVEWQPDGRESRRLQGAGGFYI
jgi:hypothetical protein